VSCVLTAEWVTRGLPHASLTVPADQAALLEGPRAGSIRVSVTDSGAGLSPQQLAQICSEGVQFNANQLQAGQGSGLGLFISKGLTEAHGGVLQVSSDGLGQGSTFRMELPLYRVEEDVTPYGSHRTKPTMSKDSVQLSNSIGAVAFKLSPSGKAVEDDCSLHSMEGHDLEAVDASDHTRPRRILVVDDADSNRKLLMRILKAKGYLCDGAANGQEACDVFGDLQQRGEIVDAVLMDYEMPVLDGPDATKVLRDMGCKCLIVGVTGNVLPADIDHFKSKGANTVLAKPLNIEAFESIFKSFRPAALPPPIAEAVLGNIRVTGGIAMVASTGSVGSRRGRVHPEENV
jgi:CheY-like chemotaxis protein